MSKVKSQQYLKQWYKNQGNHISLYALLPIVSLSRMLGPDNKKII